MRTTPLLVAKVRDSALLDVNTNEPPKAKHILITPRYCSIGTNHPKAFEYWR